ncbi:MAG TPA: IPT/TIG domain-containing protein [Mucilaginibacter sp.]|nr:IPT/TIG domain-containing protein [Mucilaginibacter sp.]
MKSIRLIIFYSLTFIILFAGCKKENSNKPVIPPPIHGYAIEAKSAVVYPDGGVTLTGTIHKIPDSLKSYGFILATDSALTMNFIFVAAKGPAALGDFKVDVNTGLLKNKKYYYAPFYSKHDASNVNVYPYREWSTFNVKFFDSDGSKSIRVDSIYPLKGIIGDTITIKGKYFSKQGLNVAIGGHPAWMLFSSSNDTIVKFAIPEEVSSINPIITIQYGTTIDTASKAFTLSAPIINSFTSLATFRDTLTINGNNFGYTNSLNEVDFGVVKASIVSSSSKQLRVIVPDGLTSINSVITLKAQLQTATAAAPFRVRRPVITSVTPTASVNGLITITGKYFHPVAGSDMLYFENINTPVNSGSATQLQANLPQGPFPRRKVAVTLKFLDTLINWSQDIQLKDRWIWVNTTPFAAESALGSFTINNTSYVVAPAVIGLAPQVFYLWKFNPTDLSWQQINIPVNFSKGIMTCTATKAYLYTTDITNNFWEYDPASNIWSQKATYPAGTRYSGTMFTIGTKIYLGLGQSSELYGGNNPPDNTLYQYDISADSWTQKASYPADAYTEVLNAASMVFGNKAIVFGDANVQDYNKVFSYDPSSDTWTAKADFNSNTNGKNAFVYNNYGFVAGMVSYSFPSSDYRSCFKYNSRSDAWAILPDDIGQVAGLGILQAGFAFINNGVVYVGGGDGPYNQLYSTNVSAL